MKWKAEYNIWQIMKDLKEKGQYSEFILSLPHGRTLNKYLLKKFQEYEERLRKVRVQLYLGNTGDTMFYTQRNKRGFFIVNAQSLREIEVED